MLFAQIHITYSIAAEFMNYFFADGVLGHGQRYVVCVYANSTTIKHETWLEVLTEVSECSDGVVVDLTPPQAGQLWIGNIQDMTYQVYCKQASYRTNNKAIEKNIEFRM